MAKDERAGAADKGKGKVDDVRELNGEKKGAKDVKKTANGKKEEETKEGIAYPYTIPFLDLVGTRGD